MTLFIYQCDDDGTTVHTLKQPPARVHLKPYEMAERPTEINIMPFDSDHKSYKQNGCGIFHAFQVRNLNFCLIVVKSYSKSVVDRVECDSHTSEKWWLFR